MLEEILIVAVYCILGTVLMLLGTFVIDLAIPCEFPTEIKRKNTAVGYVMAGTTIGISLIIKAAVMSPYYENVEQELLAGVASTAYYYAIGLVFLVLGYILLNIINKKYDLNKEIGDGNPAAGIMVAGIFIGLANIISGVIM